MAYVEGFVAAVPAEKKDEYRAHAASAEPLFKEFGARRLVEAWGDDVFHTVIRRTVKFSDSTVAGEPITSYASDSPGAEAYRTLAKEVLVRCLDA